MAIAQPFIIERRLKPARYKMAQVNLAAVFKFVDDFANDAAAAVCSHGCVEVDLAVGTVGAGKRASDRAFEGLRTCLAKWGRDADDLFFAFIAEIVAGSEVFPANRARRRIEQRYGSLEQLRLVKRDHVLA